MVAIGLANVKFGDWWRLLDALRTSQSQPTLHTLSGERIRLAVDVVGRQLDGLLQRHRAALSPGSVESGTVSQD